MDLLEGLEVFIANPVELKEDDEIILVPSGSVVLDGMKAVKFVSFTDADESDLEYRGRHQKFVQSLLKRMSEKTEYIYKMPLCLMYFIARWIPTSAKGLLSHSLRNWVV